ncbi:hypothetical protein L210DRAFT_3502325 [Boletus edulis BED1]|uniref:Uncharacterized protein n=1 Tax=Boletus edulis BED1 TaxID=1328754 RepID=A0AAD4C1M1_BOLED|nr:hypothetical protein L210DRAFT_3502325 [Boletus edulis BED1]
MGRGGGVTLNFSSHQPSPFFPLPATARKPSSKRSGAFLTVAKTVVDAMPVARWIDIDSAIHQRGGVKVCASNAQHSRRRRDASKSYTLSIGCPEDHVDDGHLGVRVSLLFVLGDA